MNRPTCPNCGGLSTPSRDRTILYVEYEYLKPDCTHTFKKERDDSCAKMLKCTKCKGWEFHVRQGWLDGKIRCICNDPPESGT